MGVHDYICLVIQNGQCIPILDKIQSNSDIKKKEFRELAEDIGLYTEFNIDDGVGAKKAYIVLVPDKYSKEKIMKKKYTWFSKFKYIKLEYGWDDWDFKDENGYYNYGESTNMDLDPIWKSPRYKGYWMVNFHPTCYKLFVKQKLDPKEIKWATYAAILYYHECIDQEIFLKSKKEIYKYISNKFEYV